MQFLACLQMLLPLLAHKSIVILIYELGERETMFTHGEMSCRKSQIGMKIRKFKCPSNSTVAILKTTVTKFVFCKPLKSFICNFIYISWRISLEEELDQDLCQWYLQLMR
jgi:hypothetical protein